LILKCCLQLHCHKINSVQNDQYNWKLRTQRTWRRDCQFYNSLQNEDPWWFLVNLEVSATINLPNERKKMPVFEFIDFTSSLSSVLKSCAVEKFNHFGFWFLAWNLGRNWLLTSYFSYFLCRLKFNGFTSKKNLCSVNISSLWIKSLSCSAKGTELQILFFS